MGLREATLKYVHDMIEVVGFNTEGLRMCELGNQHIKDNYRGFKTAKEYFTSLGMRHVSIDINGEDGALVLDLNSPLNYKKLGKFDVVTNIGTSEHVNNNKQCFQNIDSLCRVGGVMIHLVPAVGTVHGIRQYTTGWFVDLATKRGYKILYNIKKENRTTNYIFCTLQRV